MIIKQTNSSEETEALGYSIGEVLFPGGIVCLTGDLGAGKTAFTRGLARGLGIKEHITSPTFTIVNEYQGRLSLYHFDVYRLSDPEELLEIGFEEYLDKGGVVVIEWPDRVKELIPREHMEIEIRKNYAKGEDTREIILHPKGSQYQKLLTQVGLKQVEIEKTGLEE